MKRLDRTLSSAAPLPVSPAGFFAMEHVSAREDGFEDELNCSPQAREAGSACYY